MAGPQDKFAQPGYRNARAVGRLAKPVSSNGQTLIRNAKTAYKNVNLGCQNDVSAYRNDDFVCENEVPECQKSGPDQHNRLETDTLGGFWVKTGVLRGNVEKPGNRLILGRKG